MIGGQFGVKAGQKLRGEQLEAMLAVMVLAVALRLLFDLVLKPVRALQHRAAAGGGLTCGTLLSLAVLLLAVAPGPTSAAEAETEQIRARRSADRDISTREISIQSNFTGIEILIYGSVDFSQAKRQRQGGL